MSKRGQGFTDEAAQEDLFDIKNYIDGLSTFIEDCNTPMTISIQGSWGTGKTSIMQIVNNTLEKSGTTQRIWFNTWQFSQFNMDNELAVSLLTCLIDALSISDNRKEAVSKTTQIIRFAQNAGRLGKEVALSFLDATVGGRVADTVEKGLDRVQDGFAAQPLSPAAAIKDLKQQFTQCVEETLERTGKNRIVVFIDDLDRLEPRKAVELLEVLKLFLDCQHCVFVLAIDYDVVCRGVEAKYGALADSSADSREKGHSFFDKIIQVPFKMPVAEYNITNYVRSCFQDIGIDCPESELDDYETLIKRSVGTNPRSMKRLFNAYLLLTIVVSPKVLESDQSKQLLFAVLCMQHSFEGLYNYIVEHRADLTANALQSLATDDYEVIRERLSNFELPAESVARAQPFLRKLLDLLSTNTDREINEGEMNKLRNVLGISTITSSGDEQEMQKAGRQTVIVSSVSELNLEGKSTTEVERFVEQVKALAPDVNVSFRNNKYPHIMCKTGTGKTFADVYFRKNGFAVDCWARSHDTYAAPEIKIIFERYPEAAQADYKDTRYATIRVTDEETEAAFLKLAKACYESYEDG